MEFFDVLDEHKIDLTWAVIATFNSSLAFIVNVKIWSTSFTFKCCIRRNEAEQKKNNLEIQLEVKVFTFYVNIYFIQFLSNFLLDIFASA